MRRDEEGVVKAVKDGRGEVMVDILQGGSSRLAEGLIANSFLKYACWLIDFSLRYHIYLPYLVGTFINRQIRVWVTRIGMIDTSHKSTGLLDSRVAQSSIRYNNEKIKIYKSVWKLPDGDQ